MTGSASDTLISSLHFLRDQTMRDREVDIANLEDLEYLSEVWKKPDVSNAELRRSSGVIRRLVADRQIHKSTTPRGIKLLLNAPDNKSLVSAAKSSKLIYFQSAGTYVFGRYVRSIIVQYGEPLPTLFNDNEAPQVRLDGFCKQPVFFLEGHFVTRQDVINYVANKASGVHFDRNRKDDQQAFKVLDRIRSVAKFKVSHDAPPEAGIPESDLQKKGILGLFFDLRALAEEEDSFIPTRDFIDPVFVELSAAIRFFTESKTIKELIKALAIDLA